MLIIFEIVSVLSIYIHRTLFPFHSYPFFPYVLYQDRKKINAEGKQSKSIWDFLKRLYLFIFKERGREREREGEKHQCVVASHTSDTEEEDFKMSFAYPKYLSE